MHGVDARLLYAPVQLVVPLDLDDRDCSSYGAPGRAGPQWLSSELALVDDDYEPRLAHGSFFLSIARRVVANVISFATYFLTAAATALVSTDTKQVVVTPESFNTPHASADIFALRSASV
jgi:hypothetical protein